LRKRRTSLAIEKADDLVEINASAYSLVLLLYVLAFHFFQHMSTLRSSTLIAARSALIFVASALLLVVLRIVLNGLFDGRWNAVYWLRLFKFIGVITVVWFVVTFIYSWVKLRAGAPAEEILMADPSPFDERVPPLCGFVAMEYYALILNRTFVVFIAMEGLYGWKAEGIVTASRPMYFQPYSEMLEDPELMRDCEAIRRLSQLKGGFFIPRSDIVAADVIYGHKWGMAGIPHSGRIRLRMASGKSREFILLGSVSLESVQHRILMPGG
jgi:hypothetical protein